MTVKCCALPDFFGAAVNSRSVTAESPQALICFGLTLVQYNRRFLVNGRRQ